MADLLNSFLEAAEDDTKTLSVDSLLTEEERVEWETLVKAFDSIDIMNVGKDLKKITSMFQLNRWQQMAVLAYVKILELMMRRAKDAGALDLMQDMKAPKTDSMDYSGSMFG